MQSTCGSTSSCVVLKVKSAVTLAPFENRTVCADEYVRLDAQVTGDWPLQFVWRKDGILMPGQTGPSLIFPCVSISDLATYSVEVVGGCNSATGMVCLYVFNHTEVQKLADRTVCAGENVTFTLVISGSAPTHIQWRKGNTPLPGENAWSLTLNNVSAADAGQYCADIWGHCDMLTFCAQLAVQELVTSSPLANTNGIVGQNVTFSTTPSGAGPFQFAWRKDGNLLAGETNNALTLVNITSTNAGLYSVEVSGLCNSVTNFSRLEVGFGLAGVPRIASCTKRDDGCRILVVTGPSNRTYAIECSSDTREWIRFGTAVNTGGTISFLDANPSEVCRFYRAVLLPE